jgi:hypothetical protein
MNNVTAVLLNTVDQSIIVALGISNITINAIKFGYMFKQMMII